MTIRFLSVAALSLATVFSASAYAAAPVKTQDGILVTAKGQTLYTFDKDSKGKSVCVGPCATTWPPVMAAASDTPDGNMTLITRDDGSKQWAYKDMPVYLYQKDTKAGDKTGDNFKDIWHVIKP